MRLFEGSRATHRQFEEIAGRLCVLEEESKLARAEREAREARRASLLTRYLPAAGVIAVLVSTLNSVFHWF